MIISACPILPSSDLDATRRFFASLGFRDALEYPEDGYLIVDRDGVELHFFRAAAHIAAMSDHGAYLRVADANALSREYQSLDLPRAGIPRFVAAEDKPWGMCELVVIDQDGNLLRFGHVLPD